VAVAAQATQPINHPVAKIHVPAKILQPTVKYGCLSIHAPNLYQNHLSLSLLSIS